MTMTAAVNSSPESLWFNDTLVTIRVSAAAGRDGICVVEHHMPYGDSPPLHVHRNEDEVFHILEGTMRFRVDGADRVAKSGETVIAPKGVPHTYRAESASGVRCLTITRGADFESLLRSMSRPAAQMALPPHTDVTPEMIGALSEAAARNGIDIVGPPLA